MEILKFALKVLVIVLIYFVIFYALKIMYKDTKTTSKGRNKVKKATMGLEVLQAGENSNLKTGGVLPLADIITMGRKSDNTVVLDDKYVSSHHMKIFKRNNEYVIEDLDSTNGTKVNDIRIENRVTLRPGDVIKVGTAIFKLI